MNATSLSKVFLQRQSNIITACRTDYDLHSERATVILTNIRDGESEEERVQLMTTALTHFGAHHESLKPPRSGHKMSDEQWNEARTAVGETVDLWAKRFCTGVEPTTEVAAHLLKGILALPQGPQQIVATSAALRTIAPYQCLDLQVPPYADSRLEALASADSIVRLRGLLKTARRRELPFPKQIALVCAELLKAKSLEEMMALFTQAHLSVPNPSASEVILPVPASLYEALKKMM